ncbi:MAG: hypothetical protein COX57_03205 [Alphaproteobacteria bacterium CG_4_10_14_0_2_um_filter_63_37]|nr:MAG: hypothetical protein AUJ55_03665 [Proteobacteria bacterium CG1_02_64_396]PJA25545.1 MAG: hypothetical protein COX57_03205 [Alphaproteobacteria bacterium CG_4_10_14_0_2_um_filter_63_37]
MNSTRTTLTLALATSTLIAPLALADNPDPDLMLPVVVTAARMPQAPEQVTADTTVIDQAAIEQSQAATVADLLAAQAGIAVAATGGPGSQTSLFLRGTNSGHVLVLIDGVRVGSATSGAFDWSAMSTLNIARIEIVRGPQSTLYGADAVGGVIQIFTKRGRGPLGGAIKAEVGGRGSRSVAGSVSGTAGGVDLSLAARQEQTDGVSAAAAGSELDPFKLRTVSGSATVPVGEGEIRLIGRWQEGTAGLDGYPAPLYLFADLPNYTQTSRQQAIHLEGRLPVTADWTVKLQAGQSKDESIGSDPADPFNNYTFATTIQQAALTGEFTLNDGRLVTGIETHKDKGESVGSFSGSRTQSALFASLAQTTGGIDWTLGARMDRNTPYADQATWRAGLGIPLGAGLKLTANAGSSFKAPTLNDLYYPNSGNPNLKPEKGLGWDVGLHAQGERFEGALTGFEQRIGDLIVWSPVSPGSWTYTPANVASAKIQGIELHLEATTEATRVALDWTWLRARDEDQGHWLARRPASSGSLSGSATWGALQAGGVLRFIGKRYSDATNTQLLTATRRLELHGKVEVIPGWSLTARGVNLTDDTTPDATGYGVLGRTLYAGVEGRF